MTDTSSILFSQQIGKENGFNANFYIVQLFSRIKRKAVLLLTLLYRSIALCFFIQGQMAVNVLKIYPLLFLKLMVGDLARLLVCGTKPIKVRQRQL